MAEDQNSSGREFFKPDLSHGNSPTKHAVCNGKDETILSDGVRWSKTQFTYKCVATNIVYTTKWLLDHCGKTLKQYEPSLTVEQFSLLTVLRMYYPNPSTIHSLKENMLDKNSDVSRLVEKLRRKGWVERHDNDKDRRIADVSLTKKGLELLSKLEVEEKRWPEIFTGITEEEAGKLNDILNKLLKGGMTALHVLIVSCLVFTPLI